jgi:hypothetical protein
VPGPYRDSCVAPSQAVQRLYNNGQGGGPNHRYAINPVVIAGMVAQGDGESRSHPEGRAFERPAGVFGDDGQALGRRVREEMGVRADTGHPEKAIGMDSRGRRMVHAVTAPA